VELKTTIFLVKPVFERPSQDDGRHLIGHGLVHGPVAFV